MDGVQQDQTAVISIRGLRNQFGTQVIHDGLDLDVRAGEILGVVGGSGTGKTVLLRTIIGLNIPVAGEITLMGEDVRHADDQTMKRLRSTYGVLFQGGALFSSLTVAENIQVPMIEHAHISKQLMDELAALKVQLVGLPPNAANKYPSELSGGMIKRAGLARALSLDPQVVFLDEPTSGLDPIGAAAFDNLIRSLQQSLGISVFMITHDLDSLSAICDRIAVLVDKKIHIGTMEEIVNDPHPWIQEYFNGPRARAALQGHMRAEGG